MTVQSNERRSEQVIIFMTPEEKRAATDMARQTGMTLAEFVRCAIEECGPDTVAARTEMADLIARLHDLNERNRLALEATERRLATLLDDEAIRARHRAAFEAMELDWTAVAKQLGLARNQA